MLQEFQKRFLVLSTGVKGLGIGKQNKDRTLLWISSLAISLMPQGTCSIMSSMLPKKRLGLGAQLANEGLTSETSRGVSILSRPVDVEGQWALRAWAT